MPKQIKDTSINYPKQLTSSLLEHMDKRLIDFYFLEEKKLFSRYKNLHELIEKTLTEYIGTYGSKKLGRSEFYNLRYIQIKNRKDKKKRWAATFSANSQKYQLTEKKNPFYMIQKHYNELTGRDFFSLYNDYKLEDVIENYKAAMEKWASDTSCILIEYPFLSSMTKIRLLKAFKTDLVIDLADIVIRSMNGRIDSFFSKKPNILMDSPLFSESKHSIKAEEKKSLEHEHNGTAANENSLSAMLATVTHQGTNMVPEDIVIKVVQDGYSTEVNNLLKVFDERDNKILLELINSTDYDFYETKTVNMDIASIAKAINPRPSAALYEDVKTRIQKMAATSFKFYKKENMKRPYFTLNFFDYAKTDGLTEKENNTAQIMFGQILYDAITKNKMTSVPTSSYELLNKKVSRLLYHNLQRERIILYRQNRTGNTGYLYKRYYFSFFQNIILFKSKRKAENIKLVIDSLNEFVENHIAISEFHYNSENETFDICFFTLTEDEKSDLIIDSGSEIDGHNVVNKDIPEPNIS